MSTELIVILAVVAVLVLLAVAFLAIHRRGAERRRTQGAVEARARRTEAGRLEGTAEEERATAEQLRVEADRERQQADAHLRRADEAEQTAEERDAAAHEAAERARINVARADKVDPDAR